MLDKKLESLQKRQERLESQIAELEELINICNQDIKGETNGDRRYQLNIKIENYYKEIDELYEKFEENDEKINQLKSNNNELSANNHLDNPKNQQELKLNEWLPYVDFSRALETFKNIQSQFDQNGDVALFFMGESFSKKGDLYLLRLKDELKLNNNRVYQQRFPPCHVQYTSGNLQGVIQEIGNHFGIKPGRNSLSEYIELVVEQIGNSLQTNSVFFIEITCKIIDESEIDTLIPWFINNFWQPLRAKVGDITNKYEGIKVVTFIVSDFGHNLLEGSLSCYYNNHDNPFARDKLIEIILEKSWTEEDIFRWLGLVNPGLTKNERQKRARRIYGITQGGSPTIVCEALKQEWIALIQSIHDNQL